MPCKRIAQLALLLDGVPDVCSEWNVGLAAGASGPHWPSTNNRSHNGMEPSRNGNSRSSWLRCRRLLHNRYGESRRRNRWANQRLDLKLMGQPAFKLATITFSHRRKLHASEAVALPHDISRQLD